MIQITVTAVDRTVLDLSDATAITLPTTEGELTMLAGHVPLVTVLAMGELVITREGGHKENLFVDGGIVEVSRSGEGTRVEILANVAEHARELDVIAIEAAKARAEQLLRDRPTDIDLTQIELSLQRELRKLKLSKNRRL